ncbi:MAG: hypothetical protein P8X94_06365 [Woeseiaceae bacterium]
MDYQALTTDDLANVRELNRVWLELPGLTPPVPLTRQRRDRLAATPFLLFSLQPADEAMWRCLLADECQHDLFRRDQPVSAAKRDLQADGLAFLWSLARRNPYVARLITGAPLGWCERVAALTLVRIQACARSRDIAEPLLPEESALYRRLFTHGSSGVREKRVAAQLAVMQALLTAGRGPDHGRLAAAACRMPAPRRRIADEV